MTSENEQEAAVVEELRHYAAELSAAMKRAADLGLHVEVDTVDTTTFEDRETVYMVQVRIERRTAL